MAYPVNPGAIAHSLAHGAVVAGKYRVERVLGQGGMGMVLAAQHVSLGTPVALKVLLPEAQHHRDVHRRFLREAQAAANLHGDHVARVIDVGLMADGAPYMVMEYLDGTDLAGLVKQRGPLPLGEVVDYVLQAIEAVAEAHSMGIVHRDLKPANLFLTHRPGGMAWIKVLDFGISKLVGADGERQDLTATRTALGSPLYMSPEQLRSSRSVDSRTDIWALGVILFELLTGDCPFGADTLTALTLAITLEAPQSLRGLRPDVPPELETIVLRCLEKQPDARFPDVAQLARALLPYCSSRAGRAAAENAIRILDANAQDPIPPSHAQAASTAEGTQHSTNLTFAATQARAKTPAVIVGLVLGLLVSSVLLATALWAMRSRIWAESTVSDFASASETASDPTGTGSALPVVGAASVPVAETAPAPVESAVPAAPSSLASSTATPPSPVNPRWTPVTKPPPVKPKGGTPDTAIDSRH
jgi:serine/threonine-protein kinase